MSTAMTIDLKRYLRPNMARARAALASMRPPGGVATIRVRGEIGKGQATRRAMERSMADASTLLGFFDSIGGSVDEASQILALVAEHPAPRKRAIVRECSSAAVIVLMGFEERVARPAAKFGVHGAALEPGTGDERWTAVRYARTAQIVRAADDAMIGLFQECIPDGDAATFAKAVRSGGGKTFGATEALAMGLVTEIVDRDGRTVRRAGHSSPASIAAALGSRQAAFAAFRQAWASGVVSGAIPSSTIFGHAAFTRGAGWNGNFDRLLAEARQEARR